MLTGQKQVSMTEKKFVWPVNIDQTETSHDCMNLFGYSQQDWSLSNYHFEPWKLHTIGF